MSNLPLAEVRNGRLQKAAALRELGIAPYPSQSRRTTYVRPLLDEFEAREGQEVTVAGRLMSWRKQGALAFGHVQDHTGRMQLFFRRDTVRPTDAAAGTLGYEELKLLDVGDIVDATGTLVRTQRGEISVLVQTARMLTKSLRPLPDKWAGLTDRQTILRKRFLDTTIDREPFERFEAISRMLYAARVFFAERGFLEFHTPVLQPQYGGGTAKPFLTHVNALDTDVYLAISHELYLKRLIAAGYDRVFTIGRYFRNEGIDRSHHPEFAMIETMTAYANYEYNMDLIEELFRFLGKEAFGKTQFSVRGHLVDFAEPWERVSMADAVLRQTGIDFRSITEVAEANRRLRELGLHEAPESVGHALALAFEERVGETLIHPTLVFGHPVEISPLAKPMADDPRYVERFEIFIAGMECGDNWSEQNDPVQLLERWKSSYRPEDRDSGEFHPLDYDFIEALEYGIPPTTGIGPGIERMAMIFTEQENMDDVVFFPLMKPVVSEVNRAIYDIPERRVTPPAGDDLVVTADDFRSLVSRGALRPESDEILATPHVRYWGPNGAAERAGLITGHLALEGVIGNRAVRIPWPTESDAPEMASQEAEVRKMADFAEGPLAALLRESRPDVKLRVRHAVRAISTPDEA